MPARYKLASSFMACSWPGTRSITFRPHPTRAQAMIRTRFVACLLVSLYASSASGREVTIGIMNAITEGGTWSGPYWAKISGCAIMAVRHLNLRNAEIVPDVAKLPQDFNVSFLLEDSGFDPSVAVQSTHSMVQDGADALVGPVLSACAGPASLISGISKIPVVGYASRAPSLSDKLTYPYFARTVMSDSTLIWSILQVCKLMGWSSISVLYQDDAWGKGVAEAINTAAGHLNVQILTSQQFNRFDPASITSAVNAGAQYGGRIYIYAAFEGTYDSLFFAADDANIVGRGKVWINALGAGIPHDMVAASSDQVRMQRVLSGVLEMSEDALFEERAVRLASVLAQEDPEDIYHEKLGPKEVLLPQMNGAPDARCGYMYDATMAAGLALAGAKTTEDGKIDRADVLARVRNSDFQGATGRVKLNPENGDRSPDGMTMVMSSYVPALTEDSQYSMVSRRIAMIKDGEIVKLADPYWAGGMESWDQAPGDGFQCKSGYALSEETLRCEACPPGTEQLGAFCKPCALGRHGPEAAMVACPKCTEGFANTTGLVLCRECPALTYRPAGTDGINVSECVCVPGTYSKLGPGTPCHECPAGAVCPGGTKAPYPQPGFWGEKECEVFGGDLVCEGWFQFLQCRGADCVGGLDFDCAPGRDGRLCRNTADGWYNVGRVVFLECSDGGTALAVLGILGVVMAWTAIVAATLHFTSIDVLVQFMLVNAMVTTYKLKWHSRLDSLNVFLKITNFDIDFVSFGCFGRWRPEYSFYMQLFLPLLVTILYVLFLIVYRAVLKPTSGHSLSANALKVFISLAITVYHTALYKSFAAFRCATYPDGKQYHSLYPEIECWQPSHISMVVFGALYIALGGLALPAWLWHRIRTHRAEGTLQDEEVDFIYWWLHRRYHMRYKNWWVVVCFRRLAVSLVAAMIPWSMVQGVVTVMLIMALLTAQVMVRPHVSHRIDMLEFYSKVMTNLYVLGGMLMYGSVTIKAQGRVCAEDASGVDELFCDQENAIKDVIAYLTLLAMAFTLAFAGFLSFTLAWDDRNAFKASQLLARWHKSGGIKKVKGVQEEKFDYTSIGHILNSVSVLRWISEVSKTSSSPSSRQGSEAETDAERDIEGGASGSNAKVHPHAAGGSVLSSEEFAEVQLGLSNLVRHFKSAKSVRAEILTKVCSTPGLLEWIAVEPEGRQSMLRFVNGFANFLRREKQQLLHSRSFDSQAESGVVSLAAIGSDSGRIDGLPIGGRSKRHSLVLSLMDLSLQTSTLAGGPHQSSMFPVSDLVNKEHLATAAYYMMTCSESSRLSFCTLLDAILRSTHQMSIQDFARSASTGSHASGPLMLQREVSAAGHRRLSLDDYQPESPPCSPDRPSAGAGFSPGLAASPRPAGARERVRKTFKDRGSADLELYVQAHLVTPRTVRVDSSPNRKTLPESAVDGGVAALRWSEALGSGEYGVESVEEGADGIGMEGLVTAREYGAGLTDESQQTHSTAQTAQAAFQSEQSPRSIAARHLPPPPTLLVPPSESMSSPVYDDVADSFSSIVPRPVAWLSPQHARMAS